MKTGQIQKYTIFEDIGYFAGIIRKGQWNSQDDIYNDIKSAIGNTHAIIITPIQLHESDIVMVDSKTSIEVIKADGVVSMNGRYCLTVRTADCLPLLLADPVSGLFGAVHIGWRGIVGGIVDNLIIIIKNLDIELNRLYISLGPCIGDCCFEVGGDVAVLFDDNFVAEKDGGCFLDVKRLIREKLISSGVPESNFSDISECTSCLVDKYYSYRRDGQAPLQMVSYICKK